MSGRRWWGWSWGLVWFGFCLFVLLIPVLRLSGSEQSDLIESLQRRLTIISAEAESLQQESLSWKGLSEASEQRVKELLVELAGLKLELSNSNAYSESLQQQVQELKALQAESERKLQDVSRISLASAQSWKSAYDNLRIARRRSTILLIIAGVVATGLGVWAGYEIGQHVTH